MWWITGLIASFLIQGCFSQPPDGFLSQGPEPRSGGFRGGGMSPDTSMMPRGGGFDGGFGAFPGGQGGGGMTGIGEFSSMGGGGGGGGIGSFTPGGSGSGGSPSGGECTMDQRVQGIRCSGQGRDVTDCPSGSTCYRAGGYCCWENVSPVEAPCEDPMMQGSTFVQCSPGDQSQACPGSCHRCQTLGGDMGMGLCCPQITRPGCENSSPMRNAFEEARRRIMRGGSSVTDTSTTSGTGGGEMTTPARTPGRRFQTVAPPMGACAIRCVRSGRHECYEAKDCPAPMRCCRPAVGCQRQCV